MSAEQPPTPGPPGGPSPGDPGTFTQQFQHAAVSARVPEKVNRGVFSTGALILQGPTEFVLDFVQRLTQPHQIVARVALPIPVVPNFVAALRENLDKFTEQFGAPKPLPQMQPPARPPSITEIYEQLKLPDEQLSGVYANAVLIGHTASEFGFDFITTFYPRSSVSARVFLSASQVPGLLAALTSSYQQYLHNVQAAQQQHRPPAPPSPQ